MDNDHRWRKFRWAGFKNIFNWFLSSPVYSRNIHFLQVKEAECLAFSRKRSWLMNVNRPIAHWIRREDSRSDLDFNKSNSCVSCIEMQPYGPWVSSCAKTAGLVPGARAAPKVDRTSLQIVPNIQSVSYGLGSLPTQNQVNHQFRNTWDRKSVV